MEKRLIAISFLIIALSVAYYFVIFLPQKEKQKLEQEKLRITQEQHNAAQKEEEAKSQKESLDSCLLDAEIGYSKNWNKECRSQELMSAACVELTEMTIIDYTEKNKIDLDKSPDALKEFMKKQADCSCRLPLENSDRIDKRREEEKEVCYRRFGN